jgi:hypothetical protein
VIGLNCSDLEQEMQQAKEKVVLDSGAEYTEWLSWDGSQHDSRQKPELIDCVDTPFVQGVFHHVMSCLDFPGYLWGEVYRCLTQMKVPVICYGKSKKGRRKVLFEGQLNGTTFSGHSIRTTLGNTLRVIAYAKYVCHLAKIPEAYYQVRVAGDDVIMCINHKYREIFWQSFWTVYAPRDYSGFHGLGQVAKDPASSRYNIDFLSKFGVEGLGVVMMNRKIDRALLSGNTTSKLRPKTRTDPGLTIAQHVAAITDGLLSWGRTWPVISSYIQFRLATLQHERGGRMNKEYCYVFHTNEHDHSAQRGWLLAFLNMPAVVFAERQIERAMTFIGLYETPSSSQ